VAEDAHEARQIAAEKLAALERLSWDELDAYGTRDERVTAPSGSAYRIKSAAFWDMDEWASGMELSVKVYAARGLRRLWPYKAYGGRGGPDDLVPERPRP
jgi:hypothetical protein